MRRVKGGEREGESCWKSGGGRTRLYTWPRVRLADEASSDAIPDAAGGEGGHGAAKPHGVIHRCLVYQKSETEVRRQTLKGQTAVLFLFRLTTRLAAADFGSYCSRDYFVLEGYSSDGNNLHASSESGDKKYSFLDMKFFKSPPSSEWSRADVALLVTSTAARRTADGGHIDFCAIIRSRTN
jgi:hypothetical protein